MKRKLLILICLIFGFLLIFISSKLYRLEGNKPSSVDKYCLDNSGIVSIISGSYGEPNRMCILPNGTICDLFNYYFGECPGSLVMSETGLAISKGDGSAGFIAKLNILINPVGSFNEIVITQSGTIYSAGIGNKERLNIKKIKNDKLMNTILSKECPYKHRECRFKSMGENQILYTYGINKDGWFDYGIYFVNKGQLFSLTDKWMEGLLELDKQKYPKKFTGSSFEEEYQNGPSTIRYTISNAIFYGHDLMDSIRNPRD